MNLEIFPMDVQKCTMEVESFGYDMTNLIFEWQKTEPIQLKGSLQLPQFTIKGYRRGFLRVADDVIIRLRNGIIT